jgi:N-methylhydantoinase B/oxoprolinase/acetone carboxylase alpha subunit
MLIHTPGGGGYGADDRKDCKVKRNNPVNDGRKWLDSLMYSS